MKRILSVVLLFSMNMNIVSAASVKVQEVQYNESEQSFTVATEIEGQCNANLSFRVRGCSDLIVPYTCIVDVNAVGGEECSGSSREETTVSLLELNLYKKQMSGGTVIFQNNKGKTRKSIKLSNLR